MVFERRAAQDCLRQRLRSGGTRLPLPKLRQQTEKCSPYSTWPVEDEADDRIDVPRRATATPATLASTLGRLARAAALLDGREEHITLPQRGKTGSRGELLTLWICVRVY